MSAYCVTIILTALLCTTTLSQKLCNFTSSLKSEEPVFLQHFSTMKCLKVSGLGILPDSKIVLDECSYWNQRTIEQQVTLSNNSPFNRTILKVNGGKGEFYCLTTKKGFLFNQMCNKNNMEQNWTLKPVKNSGGRFTIEQFSTKKCLIPRARTIGSPIQLTPCNSLQTEQLWKVCA